MISVKGGTQTWSNSAQRTDFKSDGVQNVSASDKAKYFESDSIGDTLNKVADPGYVDTSKKMRTVGENQLGKDAFMTLLLTQMKNQDPTNPMKSHEMAAQLAQFTSLEKLNNINEGIDKLRKDNQPDHNFQALSMIGKSVTMDNSKITRNATTESHDLRFVLPADAVKADLEVKDVNGNVVRKIEMKNLKAGANQLAWNGQTDDNTMAPVGDYTLSIDAFGSNGKKLYVQTKAEGIITGVNFTAHGAQLLMGKNTISLADVKTISDPNAGNQGGQALMAALNQAFAPPPAPGTAGQPSAAQAPGSPQVKEPQSAPAQAPHAAATTPIPPAAVHKVEVKPEAKSNANKKAQVGKGNLNDSAMAQGLINQLEKEGAKAGGMSGT